MGGDAADFWLQTPRSFVTIMEGLHQAAKRRLDEGISIAWHTEAFARSKRLKKLSAYLNKGGEAKTGVADLMGFFEGLKKAGRSVTIKRLN